MSTLWRPDAYDILGSHTSRIRDIEIGCPPFIEPPTADLLNGWSQAADSDSQWEFWGYRICDGQLEFRGHLMPGTLGLPAYTLPASFRIFYGNPTWVSHMITGPDTFVICHIKVNSQTGNVLIYS